MKHQLLHGDCLELLKSVPDDSVNLILCDLPYSLTGQGWDKLLPMSELWPHYLRVLRKGGKVVLTATNPFAAYLIMSAPKVCPFKYDWAWVKNGPTNFVNAKKAPMRKKEMALVFQRETGTYNPQGLVRCVDGKVMKNSKCKMAKKAADGAELVGGNYVRNPSECYVQEWTNYPTDVLFFPRDHQLKHRLHPTQKPVALFEYLIRTYTNPGDVVLDNCAGSFTTTIAAMRSGRSSICMERDEKFFDRGKARYEAELNGVELKGVATNDETFVWRTPQEKAKQRRRDERQEVKQKGLF